MTLARFSLVAVAAFLGCSSDAAVAPGVLAPTNTCDSNGNTISECSGYVGQKGAIPSCTKGLCSVSASIAYTLVVSLPEDGRFAPGSTVAMTSADLKARMRGLVCDMGQKCGIPLPPMGRGVGYYGALPSAQVQVNWSLGAPKPSMGGTAAPSIPVHTTFRPLVPGSQTVRAVDGGLDMPTLFADVTSVLAIFPLPQGPLGTAPIGFDVPLPVGAYERTIQPDPPFDSAFPPLISDVPIIGEQFDSVVLGAGQFSFDIPSAGCSASQCIKVTTPTGKNLDGWSVFIRDTATQRPISTVTRLAGGVTDVRLFTVLHPTLLLVDLVVAPPPELPFAPTLVNSAGQVGFGGAVTYPNVPAPSLYSARVVSPDGNGVPSRVFLYSEQIDVCGSDCTMATPDNQPLLRYEAQVTTDADGHFSVKVPPGTYEVATIPNQKTGLAISVVTRVVGQGGAVGGSIPVLPPALMKGSAVLTDGRPLAGADVEARGTAQPQTTTGHFASLVRVGHATTDANGFFAMPLDPGYYDITVKPAAGTRFPWIVIPALLVQPSTVPIDLRPLDFVVPVPIDESKTLLDGSPSQTPVRGALVRAYACRGQCDPSLKTVDVEIGRAYTDQDGHYEMFLAEQQQ